MPQYPQLQNVISRNIRVCRTLPNRHDSSKEQSTTIHRKLHSHTMSQLQCMMLPCLRMPLLRYRIMFQDITTYKILPCYRMPQQRCRTIVQEITAKMQGLVKGCYTSCVGPSYRMVHLKCRVLLQDVTYVAQDRFVRCHKFTTYIVGPFYRMSPPTPQERDMVFYTYIKDKNCIEMSQSLCRMMLQDITLKVENLVVGCRTCYAGPCYRMAQYLLIRLCYKKSHITCRNHHEMSHILRRIVYKMSHIYCVNFKCTGAHTI